MTQPQPAGGDETRSDPSGLPISVPSIFKDSAGARTALRQPGAVPAKCRDHFVEGCEDTLPSAKASFGIAELSPVCASAHACRQTSLPESIGTTPLVMLWPLLPHRADLSS